MATTSSKRKKAVAATVAAAAILLAGTFAWTSISQNALNETIVDVNPGGRLHDDFNGTNKDVYVENFNSKDDPTAVPIYARIRLDQYMEIGPDAGINVETGTTGRNVEAIKGGDSYDKSTWETYIPESDIKDGTVQAQTHWQWTLGNGEDNKPYYMPTFNMNKDSLMADINGTYEGTIEDDIVHYDDYKNYTATDSTLGTEVVDWDSDTLDEDEASEYNNGGVTTDETTPIDGADVLHREGESHDAKQITSTATVITMDQWINMGSPIGPYWVYDTDGWAYWAQVIQPGDTTGLFLDGITMNKTPDENWYYGINVVAQFATAGDLSAFDQAAPTGGGGMSSEAKDLMAEITELGETLSISGAADIEPGTAAQYSLSLKKAGIDAGVPTDAEWSIENINAPTTVSEEGEIEDGTDTGIQVDATGLVTVGADVTVGTTFEVKAVSGKLEDTLAVAVLNPDRTAPTISNAEDTGTYQMQFTISDVTETDFPLTVNVYAFETEDAEYADENIRSIITITKSGGVLSYEEENKSAQISNGKVVSIEENTAETIEVVYNSVSREEQAIYFGVVVEDNSGNQSKMGNLFLQSPEVGCFAAGTQVVTADGLVNIEDIQLGDMVYSVNMETGEKELAPVTWVQEYRITEETYTIHIGDEVIVTTPEHPFYVEEKGWIAAEDLKAGDKLRSMNGSADVIENIVYTALDSPIQVYNFTVDGNHNYLITDAELLVHNIVQK